MVQELPRFTEIAAQRISSAGARDKTINVKIAINTARMMVDAEQEERAALIDALDHIVADLDMKHPTIRLPAPAEHRIRAALAKVRGEG